MAFTREMTPLRVLKKDFHNIRAGGQVLLLTRMACLQTAPLPCLQLMFLQQKTDSSSILTWRTVKKPAFSWIKNTTAEQFDSLHKAVVYWIASVTLARLALTLQQEELILSAA